MGLGYYDYVKIAQVKFDWAFTNWSIERMANGARAYLHDGIIDAFIESIDDGSTLTSVTTGFFFAAMDAVYEISSITHKKGESSPEYFMGNKLRADRFLDYSWLLNETDLEFSFPYRLPTNSFQFKVADQLMDLIALFTLLHEASHNVVGHLDALQAMGLNPRINENPSSYTDSIDAATLRVLRRSEMEADRIAFSVLLHAGNDKRILNSTHFGKIPRYLWDDFVFIATALVMCLFQKRMVAEEMDPRSSTHPSPGCRLINILEFMILNRDMDYKSDDLYRCFEHLHTIFKLLDLPLFSAQEFIDAHYEGTSPKLGSVAEEFIDLYFDDHNVSSPLGSKLEQKIRERMKQYGISFPKKTPDSGGRFRESAILFPADFLMDKFS